MLFLITVSLMYFPIRGRFPLILFLYLFTQNIILSVMFAIELLLLAFLPVLQLGC